MSVLTESRTRPAGSSITGEADQAEALFREARRVADAQGRNIGHSKLSRLCRAYCRAVQVHPALTLETYLRRTWADPTGERATRRADRRGGARA